MHYHAVAHAIRVSDFTIVPKELKYVTTMGTEKMAFLDAKVINDIYCSSMPSLIYDNCAVNKKFNSRFDTINHLNFLSNFILFADVCVGRPTRTCLAGGYPDPNNCNRCRCPEGLGGYDCSMLQPSSKKQFLSSFYIKLLYLLIKFTFQNIILMLKICR